MQQLKQIREPQIMGILNVTEDSFSDGGSYLSLELALNRARQMIEEGAAIIDVGAESTRPGSLPVDLDTELERVVPTVEAIKKEFPAITVSVDTRKSEVAKASLQAGATIINDISALRDDEQMAETVASHPGAQIVLMHMQGDPRTMQIAPRYENILKEVDEFFEERISFAVERGIDREMIILDPGIGFGKDLTTIDPAGESGALQALWASCCWRLHARALPTQSVPQNRKTAWLGLLPALLSELCRELT